MGRPDRLLVIAPDAEFRRSLCFMLASEGHEIIAQDNLAAATGPALDIDCMIVDGLPAVREAMALHARKPDYALVLIVERLAGSCSTDIVQMVEKPSLGQALVTAVDTALMAHRRRRTRAASEPTCAS